METKTYILLGVILVTWFIPVVEISVTVVYTMEMNNGWLLAVIFLGIYLLGLYILNLGLKQIFETK